MVKASRAESSTSSQLINHIVKAPAQTPAYQGMV